jgi:hypothetical protein
MKKKYCFIPPSIFGLIAIIAMVSISEGKPEPEIAMLPYVEFEATVVSLSLDESGNYHDAEELINAPNDSAVVRIDKIIKTGGSFNFDWASVGIEKGKEVSLNFKYTVRPAKIITVLGETTQAGTVVSHRIMPAKIMFKNNYFIFKENGNSNTETILPGLQEGFKFKTKLWNTLVIKVGKYEIIPF